MAKTQLTLDIEEALYFYEIERGDIVVEEVGMPDDWGIVDTLSLRTSNDGTHEWRCYEIKVSKSDFRSSARLTFVGHYNYYVLPKPLYEAVKEEIPSHIGVMLYMPFQDGFLLEGIAKGTLSIVRKATKQELLFEENRLMHAFLHSMFREVRKAKNTTKGLGIYSSETLFLELQRRPLDGNFYGRLVHEMEQEAIWELEAELQATRQEHALLRKKWREQVQEENPVDKPLYVPYFRGKQFDLLALKECVMKGLLGTRTIPLVEPVRDSPHLRKTLEAFIKMEREILVVINPGVGQVQKGVSLLHGIDDLLASPYVIPTYLIDHQFDYRWISEDDFAFISQTNALDVLEETIGEFTPRFHLIADNALLRKTVTAPRILLTDPFTRLKNNGDYLLLEDEFFSDEWKFCGRDGYVGYSDFGIDGAIYFDKGWPSRAVVLHILYVDTSGSIRIKHFCSDSNETASNPAGKFFEALEKLADWQRHHPEEAVMTTGLRQLLSYRESKKFPGSGTIKKLSVMHQLELMKHI